MSGRQTMVALIALAGCTRAPPQPEGPSFVPGTIHRAQSSLRGQLDRRGLIHAHSVYSHDACDSMPEVDGVRDEVCFADFRRGLCQSQHDFVMLTDHRDAFSGTPFPEVLLHRPDRGDRLVQRGGSPTASWAACPDGTEALILAGAESGTMPVGLERHVGGRAERSEIYGSTSTSAIAALKAHGAVVLLQHTESWKVDDLANLPIDGFEMYNLHANSFLGLDRIIELVLLAKDSASQLDLPHPDLAVLDFISEDPRYLDRWSQVLARGHRRVTTMGTDCHRNSFPAKLPDGERIDSYRRMMVWFSNHLLIRPEADGTWDDRHLKDALRAGRLYGAFEVYGYPRGFDFHARSAGAVHEMGAEVQLDDGATLVASVPSVEGLKPHGLQPELTLRLLRATDEGWRVVTQTRDDLRHEVSQPGAYRVEVRMIPRHLKPYLAARSETASEEDRVWIYSNPIYVR